MSGKTYLETLRLIPEDIFLAIFAQDFHQSRNDSCICGWALREAIAREVNVAPEFVSMPTANSFWYDEQDSYVGCADRFGGDIAEWYDLWDGAANDTRKVERAVVDRLNEIVEVPNDR